MGLILSDTGAVQNIVHADEDGQLVARDVMSADRVDSILTSNHNMRQDMTPDKARNGRLHASVPITQYHEWRKEWQQNWSDTFHWNTFLAAKLNDPDNALLLTSSHKMLNAGGAARIRTK